MRKNDPTGTDSVLEIYANCNTNFTLNSLIKSYKSDQYTKTISILGYGSNIAYTCCYILFT